MATKKKTPIQVLIALFGDNGDDVNRVEVNTESIQVDEETVSEIDSANQHMASCCGILELEGVDNIAPNNKDAYKAIDALYTKQWESRGYGGVVATVNATQQKSALAFFRATDWQEVKVGANSNGQPLILFVKTLRKVKR